MTIQSLVAVAALLVTSFAQAHSYTAGSLKIDHPAARATMGSQSNGAAYLQIENTGSADDALLSASSPAAKSVEVHNMTMEGDVMKMRQVDAIEAIRLRATSLAVYRRGQLIASSAPAQTQLSLPGRPASTAFMPST